MKFILKFFLFSLLVGGFSELGASRDMSIFGALVLFILLSIWLSQSQKKKRRRTKKPNSKKLANLAPSNVIPKVLKCYDEITEKDIGELENKLMLNDYTNPDQHLLYALRVSKCIPSIMSKSTLKSRMQATLYGPQESSGLSMGRSSKYATNVTDFLKLRYQKRLAELTDNSTHTGMTSNNLEGKELEKQGKVDAAVELYEQNVANNFDGNHPYNRLAIIYRKRKLCDDEIRVLEKAIWVFENIVPDVRPDKLPKLEKFRTRLNKAKSLRPTPQLLELESRK